MEGWGGGERGDGGGFDLHRRGEGVEAGVAFLFFTLVVAVADVVDHLGEGVVVLLAFLFQLGVAVGEDATEGVNVQAIFEGCGRDNAKRLCRGVARARR